MIFFRFYGVKIMLKIIGIDDWNIIVFVIFLSVSVFFFLLIYIIEFSFLGSFVVIGVMMIERISVEILIKVVIFWIYLIKRCVLKIIIVSDRISWMFIKRRLFGSFKNFVKYSFLSF